MRRRRRLWGMGTGDETSPPRRRSWWIRGWRIWRRPIKEACVERDKNRANSRDRMAQVYQDKIDKLQRELEAVRGLST
jgi:hypothetical protein